jgi:hypothetical protein
MRILRTWALSGSDPDGLARLAGQDHETGGL